MHFVAGNKKGATMLSFLIVPKEYWDRTARSACGKNTITTPGHYLKKVVLEQLFLMTQEAPCENKR